MRKPDLEDVINIVIIVFGIIVMVFSIYLIIVTTNVYDIEIIVVN